MSMIIPPTRRRTQGVLETLDANEKPLESGGVYSLNGERVVVRQERIYEGVVPDPHSLVQVVSKGYNKSWIKGESRDERRGVNKNTIYETVLVPI